MISYNMTNESIQRESNDRILNTIKNILKDYAYIRFKFSFPRKITENTTCKVISEDVSKKINKVINLLNEYTSLYVIRELKNNLKSIKETLNEDEYQDLKTRYKLEFNFNNFFKEIFVDLT